MVWLVKEMKSFHLLKWYSTKLINIKNNPLHKTKMFYLKLLNLTFITFTSLIKCDKMNNEGR